MGWEAAEEEEEGVGWGVTVLLGVLTVLLGVLTVRGSARREMSERTQSTSTSMPST